MFRPAKWIASLTVGCWPWAAVAPVCAQGFTLDEDRTPSSAAVRGENQDVSPLADYVVEIPSDDDADDVQDSDQNSEMNAEEAEPSDSADASEEPANDGHEDPREEGAASETIKERFPNGSIRIEREVTQDLQGNYVNHGLWKMLDQRGNLVSQGEYEHGQRNGTWVRWYRSATEAELLSKLPYQQFVGPFISQGTFKNDALDGTWIIYDAKMHKISEWHFENGQRHGLSTWWYPNGRKMREIQFRNGDMDGTFLEWSPDGKLSLKDVYEGGRKLAPKLSHHQGGAKKSSGMYLMAREIEQSPDDWWNCKLRTTTKTGKDEKHGPWTSWHANGQAQLEGKYEHDVQVGPFRWWHSNGQKALEGQFDQGKQDGAWTWWYASGQKSIHGEYSHGNPTGRWTWWKEDGKVAQSADLSQSEGVVVDVPRTPEPTPPAPRMSKPIPRQPVQRQTIKR